MSTRLNNRFTVPVPVDQAWDVLMDVERVAPCMPGATLESTEGDSFTGRVRVKVGPIAVTYRGEAYFTEVDAEQRRVELHAGGKESRGSGTASATVTARLYEQDDGTTEVTVDTDFTVTGRVAQFGRGVMADVSAKLVDRFAENLAVELQGRAPEQIGAGGGSAEASADRSGGGEGSGAAAGAAAGTSAGAAGATGEAAAPADAVVPPQAGEPRPGSGHGGGAEGQDEGDGAPEDRTSTGSRPSSDIRSDRPRDDSIDLMSTVGLPVLKRALPVAGSAALLGIVFSWFRRRRKAKGARDGT
ncbi:SRPBCC family protein [Streptomonospora salina]|uniref:Carbon monoxide dehydrogenase subunit G n=1 Tax=Streptomonospora salina TaxID=104205 RepID=A0A841EE32_9ACTN|nr:SRPBCC family protein [Streptomonospora salina]MBB5999303.1 carbon monoxide dehydrogenase subunit G [Streptomonospora salina]